MPADFNAVFESIGKQVAALAAQSFAGYAKSAGKDGVAIVTSMKENLERWTKQCAAGELSAVDLEDLVKGEKDNLEIKALKQAGISAIELDKFKNGILAIVTSTICSVIK